MIERYGVNADEIDRRISQCMAKLKKKKTVAIDKRVEWKS